jgi:A/G-specific adenine glycosylase
VQKLSKTTISSFRRTVLAYYSKNGRSLPWRQTSDPYHIFISEIMLQQTQVTRVTGKYLEFISRFPTVRSLAAASFVEVLSVWSGLGYNRRAKMFHMASKEIVSKYAGEFPTNVETLDELPGIGHATASAICVYAFNFPLSYIETNIRTVFIHHFFSGKNVVSDGELLPVIKLALYHKNPRIWYSALMDYGVFLKGTIGNLSRKSKHYSKQGVFKGSVRQARGMVLRFLTSKKNHEFLKNELAFRCAVSKLVFEKACAGLKKDNLIQFRRNMICLVQ